MVLEVDKGGASTHINLLNSQQQAHCLEVAILCSVVQSAQPPHRLSVDINAVSFQQQPNRIRVRGILGSGNMQRGIPPMLSLVDIQPPIGVEQQQAHHLQVARLGGNHQRSRALGGCSIDI